MWIFCAGMMRSGSTLQYQIAKTVVEGAGRGIGAGSCVPGRFRELLDRYDDAGQLRVVKCHRYLPTARARLRRGEARALYIYRDLRDVVVSMMHKEKRSFRQMMEAGFVQQLLEDDAIWSGQPNTLVSVYQEVTADVAAEVERIAGFLGIEVAPSEVERIAAEHSLDRQKRRIEGFDFGQAGVAEGRTSLLDPDTLLHHNHVRSGRSGQWSDVLTPEQVAEIEQIAGSWLVERGFALSDDAPRSAAPVRARHTLRRGAARARRASTDLRFRVAPAAGRIRSALAAPLRRVSDAVTSVGLSAAVGGALYRLLRRSPPGAVFRLADMRRVLVVRPGGIGEVVLSGPLLRELRRNLPEAEITLVVDPRVRELVERCPQVDRVLTYDPSVPGLFGRLRRHARALALARREMWRLRLDLAILPARGLDRHHAGFLTYFSGAVRRVGYDQTVDDRLLTRSLPTGVPKHEVEQTLDVLRALGGEVRDDRLELWVDEADEADATRILHGHGVGPDEPLVALGIGAPYQRGVWPVPRYAEVASTLRSRHGVRALAIGGARAVLGESLARQTEGEVVSLVGGMTPRQMGTLLRRCALYVGNDADTMHLAVAAGIPVVEISSHPRTAGPDHPGSPTRFGPWKAESRVLRPERPLPPCTDACTGRVAHCITRVTVEEVVAAATALLEGRSS